MRELKENLNEILIEKQTKMLPENIREGVTILGVEGTLHEGIDTSDATATASDLFAPKTAYSNGEKITGNNIVTYKMQDNLNKYNLIIDEVISNPIVLSGQLDNKVIVLGTNNSVNYLYLCTVSFETQTLIIDKKVELSSINEVFTSLPDFRVCSFSCLNDVQEDGNLYLAYGTTLYLVLINFTNLTVEYKTSLDVSYAITAIISNPVYINKCYFCSYRTGDKKLLYSATYTNETLQLTYTSGYILERYPSLKWKMHISNDGSFFVISSEYYNQGSIYGFCVCMTANGDIVNVTNVYPSATPNLCRIGINPSGTRLYMGTDVYSITITGATSFSYTKIGTISITGLTAERGINFINDETLVTCDGSNARIYKLDSDGLNATLLDTIPCIRPMVYTKSLNYLLLGAAGSVSYVGYTPTNILSTLTTASGYKLYNPTDATATVNDVIANTTYYGKNGKTKGNITPITEASDIDYVSLDLQSSDIVAVDYANKYCVKRISDTGLEFYQFNGDGIIEESKIEMTVGEASAGTILKAYSFSNYSDNDGYVWLYTASIKRTGYNDEPGKKIYINVFRIDIENQTYDVFGNVSAKLTEYATSQTGGHYLKIAPRPNKNQFCVCGWLNDVSSGTYGTWVSLLINVTTSNAVTITRYTGIDTGRQSDASNQYVRCYYSSNGEYLYLNGEFSVWNSDNRVICYGVLQMSETNTVLSTIKSYSKRMKESAYDGGPTPLGLYTTYVMQGESIYNVSDLENPIVTDVLPFDTTRNRNVFVLNKYILYVSGANLNVYEFNPNDLTVTLYDTRVFDGSITNILPISEKQVVYFYNNSVKGYIMTDDVIITGLVRNGKTFLDIAHYDLPANMAVQGYKFANSSGAQVGTMPNNGAVQYTPSASTQNIANGYHNGSTIVGDANLVSANIRSGVTIFGVEGNLEPDKPDQTKTVTPTDSQQIVEPDIGYELSSVVVEAADMSHEDYVECQELADLILGDTETTDLDYVLINSVVLNDTINANVIQEDDENILIVNDYVNLPYTELEYIESTGTQCIDTGIYSKNTIGFDIKASMTSYNAYDALMFGGTNYPEGSNDQVYLRFRPDADGGINYTIPSSTNNNNRVVYYTPMPYDTATNITFIDGVATQDGENVTIDNYNVRTFTSSYTMHIFAEHDYDGIGYFFRGKLYHCKLYDGQTLVRDFIPVKRKGDNNICLYDKVSETFFTNEGTGSFIAGPEKEVE